MARKHVVTISLVVVLLSILFVMVKIKSSDDLVPNNNSTYEKHNKTVLIGDTDELKNDTHISQNNDLSSEPLRFFELVELRNKVYECYLEREYKFFLKKELDEKLRSFIQSLDNKQDIAAALSVLLDNGIINIPQAYYVMRQHEEDKIESELVSIDKTVNNRLGDDQTKLLLSYKEVDEAFKTDGKSTFIKLLKGQINLPPVKYKSGRYQVYLTKEKAMAKYLTTLTVEEINKLLDGSKLEESVFVNAIDETQDLDILMTLFESIDFKNEKSQSTNGNILNAVQASIRAGNSVLLENILANVEPDLGLLNTTATNDLVSDVLNSPDKKFNEEQSSLVRLLSSHSMPLTLWHDKQNNAYSILGKNKGVSIDSDFLSYAQGIGIDYKLIDSIDNISTMSLTSSALSRLQNITEDWKKASTSGKTISSDCMELKTNFMAKEPNFKNSIAEINRLVTTSVTFSENIETLAKISPALVDNYINIHKFQENIIDDDLVQSALAIIRSSGLSGHKKSPNEYKLNPREQTLLANEMCKTDGVEGVSQSYLIAKTIFFEGIYNNDCLSKAEISPVARSIYYERDDTYPSKVYSLIRDRDYQSAQKLVQTDSRLYGYRKGRDSLSLLLDRIVPFRKEVLDQDRTLLMELILRTKLNNFHYGRLKRLQLKDQQLFSELVKLNSNVANADQYPMSLYK